jgi:hypothetical protein
MYRYIHKVRIASTLATIIGVILVVIGGIVRYLQEWEQLRINLTTEIIRGKLIRINLHNTIFRIEITGE